MISTKLNKTENRLNSLNKEHILSTLLSINKDLTQRIRIKDYYKPKSSAFLHVYYKHEDQPVYTIRFLPHQKIEVYQEPPMPSFKEDIDFLKKILLGPNRKNFYIVLERQNGNTYDKNNLISNQ